MWLELQFRGLRCSIILLLAVMIQKLEIPSCTINMNRLKENTLECNREPMSLCFFVFSFYFFLTPCLLV